jgi:hypothetical protein
MKYKIIIALFLLFTIACNCQAEVDLSKKDPNCLWISFEHNEKICEKMKINLEFTDLMDNFFYSTTWKAQIITKDHEKYRMPKYQVLMTDPNGEWFVVNRFDICQDIECVFNSMNYIVKDACFNNGLKWLK